MTKNWTGDLVGLMHDNHITNIQLAKQMNVTQQYVSMVLNQKRTPPGAEERFTAAVKEIIASRNAEEAVC